MTFTSYRFFPFFRCFFWSWPLLTKKELSISTEQSTWRLTGCLARVGPWPSLLFLPYPLGFGCEWRRGLLSIFEISTRNSVLLRRTVVLLTDSRDSCLRDKIWRSTYYKSLLFVFRIQMSRFFRLFGYSLGFVSKTSLFVFHMVGKSPCLGSLRDTPYFIMRRHLVFLLGYSLSLAPFLPWVWSLSMAFLIFATAWSLSSVAIGLQIV